MKIKICKSALRKFYRFLPILFFSLFIFKTIQAEDFTYKVIRIVDGDTFVATDGNIKFKVRMAGLDAPESTQEYGKLAKSELAGLILDQPIQIIPVGNGLDLYGRVLAIVKTKNEDVAARLIKDGFATYYRPGCVDYPENKKQYAYDPRIYVDAEAQAKKNKKNIWELENSILPCEFRKQNKK